ncbi:hypothetical protein OEZ86_001583 [Tetradesmus obliquus]|nr:hypothetical protein OEZ86_001583 [Tetradesmus obliquus]
MYRAVASLECLEKQALANIIATASAQLLPEKQMNEAALAVKNTLFAAAAAHSYRQQQVPDSSRSSAEAFWQRGLPADCALDAGFRVGQLLRAGYSTAELVQSSTPELRPLRAAGISVHDLYASLPQDAAGSLSGVGGASALRQAGYTALAVQAGVPDGAISMQQVKPLMHMQPGSDLPELLIGTKDKLVLAGKVDAAEEPATAVMLAANPVKLAQQRKRSANGAAAAASAGGGVPGSSAASGLLSLQLPGSPSGGSGVGGGPPTAASRVRQGLEKQHTSRLRTASRETAE